MSESYEQRLQRLQPVIWQHTEKLVRECTIEDLAAVHAALERQIAEDRRRTRIAELKIAGHLAAIDQYQAWVDHGLACCNWYANGGV